ncbi:MAG: hypothetical protein PUK05_05035 [Peptoniphilaceae bacterium]|nr:hypothetical protein [Peptoniphilaceae bacterium]MDY5766370.1 hypothetical protein [Peptoniphilaceae bacterium]
MKIKDLLKSWNDRVAFLELKPGHAMIGSVNTEGVPLPIRMVDFLNGIESELAETIDLRFFLKGMVWILGIDAEFPYRDTYRKILREALREPDQYAAQLGVEELQQVQRYLQEQELRPETVLSEETAHPQDPETEEKLRFHTTQAMIAFHAAYLLNDHNTFAAVQFARLLVQYHRIADQGEDAVQEASHILEHALHHDDTNPVANEALGELNENMGNYAKATAYYQRAMAHTDQEPILNELREAVRRIAPETAIENGVYAMRHADFEAAIEILMEAKAESNRYDVDYYLGVAYQSMGNYDASVEALSASLQKGGDFGELYNALVFSLSQKGEIVHAKEVADEGVEKHPADLRLRYNRAALLGEMGRKEKAIEDLNFILEYADLSDEMFNQTMILKTKIQNS